VKGLVDRALKSALNCVYVEEEVSETEAESSDEHVTPPTRSELHDMQDEVSLVLVVDIR